MTRAPRDTSSSTAPRRCATCRAWARADRYGACTACGAPFAPAELAAPGVPTPPAR